MRVLGLDPGYHRTGYALVETHGNTYALRASGLIEGVGVMGMGGNGSIEYLIKDIIIYRSSTPH